MSNHRAYNLYAHVTWHTWRRAGCVNQSGAVDVLAAIAEAGERCQDIDTTLKIDRAFVSQLTGPRDNLEIVKAIVTMARTLGMSVIAEGVETEDQRRQLQELNCEQGQGYLFSKALAPEGVEELLGAST